MAGGAGEVSRGVAPARTHPGEAPRLIIAAVAPHAELGIDAIGIRIAGSRDGVILDALVPQLPYETHTVTARKGATW